MHYFPNADEVGPFGRAFVSLMFACARLDRRVADLKDVITGKHGFGEKNWWSARDRPKRLKKLIRENSNRLGGLPPHDVKQMLALLKRAIAPCDLRNLLAHSHWWEFDSGNRIMTVRPEKLRRGQKRNPHPKIAVADIDRAANELIDIEIELYKLSPVRLPRKFKPR